MEFGTLGLFSKIYDVHTSILPGWNLSAFLSGNGSNLLELFAATYILILHWFIAIKIYFSFNVPSKVDTRKKHPGGQGSALYRAKFFLFSCVSTLLSVFSVLCIHSANGERGPEFWKESVYGTVLKVMPIRFTHIFYWLSAKTESHGHT